MELENIITNSFKYSFNDYKNLAVICALFLIPLIAVLGVELENSTVLIIGILAIFIFLLIVPGYFVSVIKSGCGQSVEIPSLNLIKNIGDTFKLLALTIVYIIIPLVITIVLGWITGFWSYFDPSALANIQITGLLASFGITVLGAVLVFLIFTILFYIAMARLACHDSLVEALKFNEVINDVRNIGIGNVIGWYVIFSIFLVIINRAAELLLSIPYAGLILYLCIVCPIISLIFFYSLGLLCSNGSESFDLDSFEKEINDIRHDVLKIEKN